MLQCCYRSFKQIRLKILANRTYILWIGSRIFTLCWKRLRYTKITWITALSASYVHHISVYCRAQWCIKSSIYFRWSVLNPTDLTNILKVALKCPYPYLMEGPASREYLPLAVALFPKAIRVDLACGLVFMVVVWNAPWVVVASLETCNPLHIENRFCYISWEVGIFVRSTDAGSNIIQKQEKNSH